MRIFLKVLATVCGVISVIACLDQDYAKAAHASIWFFGCMWESRYVATKEGA
jgi:hypothetical protein